MNEVNHDHILADKLLNRLREEQRMFRKHSAKPTLSRHQRNQCNQLSSYAGDIMEDLVSEHHLDSLDLISLAKSENLNDIYH